MASKPRIAEADVREFVRLVEAGMQRKVAAEKLGLNIKSLKYACQRLDIPWPKRVEITDKIKQFEQVILSGDISQHEIARRLGCSQCAVNRAYANLGYPSLPVGGRTANSVTKEERIALCDEILAHIETHGGYLKPTLREMDIPESFLYHIRNYARQINFDFELYRFAHRQYGHWMTLPGKAKPVHTCDYMIPAVCTKCGTTHEVSLVNMKSGATTQCMSCSRDERRGRALCRKCKCVETGEAIRSIRQLSQRLGVPHSTVEYHFANFGKLEHDGLTYVLA